MVALVPFATEEGQEEVVEQEVVVQHLVGRCATHTACTTWPVAMNKVMLHSPKADSKEKGRRSRWLQDCVYLAAFASSSQIARNLMKTTSPFLVELLTLFFVEIAT